MTSIVYRRPAHIEGKMDQSFISSTAEARIWCNNKRVQSNPPPPR
eukprot:SAG25_NODE_2963_length_1294_cov_4.324686_1_plen_44_part_10